MLGVYNIGQPAGSKPIPPKPKGATRFVCISDTHSRHRLLNVPNGDVLVHTGDITMDGRKAVLADFDAWLGELPHAHKLVIAGNHDTTLCPAWYETHWRRFHSEQQEPHGFKNCIVLQDTTAAVNGLVIYGSPWVPAYHDWAFNLDQAGLRRAWEAIPPHVDILLTHGPPYGVLDSQEHHGDPALLAALEAVQPAVHVFGHVHQGYGCSQPAPAAGGAPGLSSQEAPAVGGLECPPLHGERPRVQDMRTTFINACSVTPSYKPINNPVVFDIL